MPEISIIVPNYNTAQFLPRCLDSLINQTFSDIEIICIDNNSTDNSLEILKQYAQNDNRVKVFCETQSGAAVARNLGLENATGKYLMFCDSDDWYEPNTCEIMHKTIEQKQVDVVCCHAFLELQEGLSESEKVIRSEEKYYNLKKYGKFSITDKVRLKTNVLLWNKIWRRDLIEKYHIRFPQGHEHEDDAFWFMYSFIANSIYYLKQKLYHYFIRQGSVMSSVVNKKPKNKMDRILVSHCICNFLMEHKLFDTFKQSMLKIYCLEFKCARSFFSDEEKQQLCDDLNKYLEMHTKDPTSFIYCDDNFIPSYRHKSIVQLYLEKFWYSIQYRLAQNEKERIKYQRKLQKTLMFLKQKEQ